MKINVPNNLKSPTVIIVGQGTANEKKIDQTASKMDNLERKLDMQYKAYTDKKDYIRLIEQLHKSFMNKLDKFVSMNKSMMDNVQSKRIDSLRNEFNIQIKGLNKNNSSDKALRKVATKLGALEEALKNMPAPKATVKIIRRNSTSPLTKSFSSSLERIERLLGKQLIPYSS